MKKKSIADSDSSSDETDSSSSSSNSEKYHREMKKIKKKLKKEERRREKRLRKKLKNEKKKLKKEKKKKREERKESAKPVTKEIVPDLPEKSSNIPIKLMEASKAMAPMTKEEWEKRQSVVRRVLDEETGRYRLIKGDGEVLEEIVSYKQHREINRKATMADGDFFESQTVNKKHRK